jgi:hypothetical protein
MEQQVQLTQVVEVAVEDVVDLIIQMEDLEDQDLHHHIQVHQ